jgi:hypothetical protein
MQAKLVPMIVTVQSKRLMVRITLHFNSDMSTAEVFLNIENTLRQHGTLVCDKTISIKIYYHSNQI